MDVHNNVQITLDDDTTIRLHFMETGDLELVRSYLKQLPEPMQFFFPAQIANDAELDWFLESFDRGLNKLVMAFHDNSIVGTGMLLQPRYGWAQGNGEIVVLVSPEFQHHGLGKQIVLHLFAYARSKGLQRIFCYLLATMESEIRAFKKADFRIVGTLTDFAINHLGRKCDLLIMIRSVEDLWAQIEDKIQYTGRSMEY